MGQLTKVPGVPTKGGPYAFGRSGLWASYDDMATVAAKAKYVMDQGLGGVSVWTIDFDDFNNLCNAGPFPLLRAVNQIFDGQTAPSVVSDFNTPRPPVTTTFVPSELAEESVTEPWDDGSHSS